MTDWIAMVMAEALLAQHFEVGAEPGNRGLGESGHFGLALVPPVGERALGIDVDQADGPVADPLRLDGEMARQGGLARPALLRGQCQYPHQVSPIPTLGNPVWPQASKNLVNVDPANPARRAPARTWQGRRFLC
jgi:hypothetical protein